MGIEDADGQARSRTRAPDRRRASAAGARLAISGRGPRLRRWRRRRCARRVDGGGAPQRRRPGRSRRCATATAAGRSPASSSVRRRRHERGRGARGRGWPADLRHRRRSPRGGQGSRDPRRDRRRVDPGRLARRPGGVGREPRLRQRADRAAAARERPADRLPRVTPAADGAPVREVFHVSPGRGVPTVYTVEIPAAAPDELVPENNARSVLVPPPARAAPRPARRGSAGLRAQFPQAGVGGRPRPRSRLGRPQGQERAGRRYVLRAGGAVARATPRRRATRRRAKRSSATTRSCSPTSRRISSRARQLETTRAFVGERGGGLLVLGARSFLRQGLADTALEDVLPLELSRGGQRPIASGGEVSRRRARPRRNRVSLTPAGEAHPVMQLAATRSRTPEAMGGRAGARGDFAARRAEAGRQRAGRDRRRPAARRARSSPSSASATDGRWSSPARPRGAGGCCCRRPIARTRRSGGRRCAGSRSPAADPIQLDARRPAPRPATRSRSPSSRATPASSRSPTPWSTCASPRRTAGSSTLRAAADSSRERRTVLRRLPAGRTPASIALSAEARQGATVARHGDRVDARRRRRSRDDRSAAQRGAASARRASASGGRVLSRATSWPSWSIAAERGRAGRGAGASGGISGTRDGRLRRSWLLLAAEWLLRRPWGLDDRGVGLGPALGSAGALVRLLLSGGSALRRRSDDRGPRAHRGAVPSATR